MSTKAAPASPGHGSHMWHLRGCVGSPGVCGISWGLSAPAGQGTLARNVGATGPEPSEGEAEGAQGLTAGTGLNTNERTEGEIFLMIVNFRKRK